MSLLKNIALRRKRRAFRNRSKIAGKCLNKKIRVSVFRSLKYFYAQAIDDSSNSTMFGMCSKNLGILGNKKNVSKEMGILFSKKLQNNNVKEIVFDRGFYLYHGRVREFADGLRAGGLSF